jgi:hypothetical protein
VEVVINVEKSLKEAGYEVEKGVDNKIDVLFRIGW